MIDAHFTAAALAIATLILGLIASSYWLKASRIEVIPLYAKLAQIEPVIEAQATDDWIIGMLESTSQSGRLNAIAAKWTAATVIVGCLTSIAGVWPLTFCFN